MYTKTPTSSLQGSISSSSAECRPTIDRLLSLNKGSWFQTHVSVKYWQLMKGTSVAWAFYNVLVVATNKKYCKQNLPVVRVFMLIVLKYGSFNCAQLNRLKWFQAATTRDVSVVFHGLSEHPTTIALSVYRGSDRIVKLLCERCPSSFLPRWVVS